MSAAIGRKMIPGGIEIDENPDIDVRFNFARGSLQLLASKPSAAIFPPAHGFRLSPPRGSAAVPGNNLQPSTLHPTNHPGVV